MSTLYLIRHGQASFGAENYDVLSELGVRQAAELGAHFARVGQSFDAIYTGPLQRQRDTTRHMRDAAAQGGVTYPDPHALEAFSEYPAIELIRHWLPRLAEQDARLGAQLDAAGTETAAGPALERAYRTIIDGWVTGELDVDGLETFAAFVVRVEGGLRHIMEREGRNRRVAVITSGGPILLAMRYALGLADLVAMKLGWIIANSSITELRWRDHELNLVGFNRIPHLADEQLVTYR